MTFASLASASGTIELAVGAQRQISAGHTLQRVAVGDPAIADVLIMKGSRSGSVLLTAKAPGATNVMLWERGRDEPTVWSVEVVDAAAHAVLDDSTPHVNAYGGTAVLRGTSASLDAHERAVAVGKNMAGKGTVIDRSTLAGKNVVQVDVRVVEFSRSVLKQVGFNFFKQSNGFSFGSFSPGGVQSYGGGSGPGTAGYIPTLGSPVASAFNLVVNAAGHGIFGDLSLLEANNLARVLAEPTLVALSGQSASFLAGGEIPVPSPQGLGSTAIQWKQYGVGLSLTPTVLSPQRIALKVAPESSQLDFVNSVTISGVAVPGITTRRADTTVELGDGESFVIGGLIDRQTMSNVSKVPLLGDLPIIGTFFKNLNYQQNDKELLIIVTPHLVAPIAKGAALPATPGELSEQRDGPVWRSYLGGVASPDAAPGFSK
ncbi:putative type II secretion system protein D [Burkholderia pseudomultivorans]|uniref:Membrane protein n=2 Tax=Burkholderia pseudomultivorans TaxID=1207504 RepID=A0A6P2NFV4_9BURK|nr:putative type II secretion system protein D [Burkholderia pseudomultivorans]MDR8737412.1 putative type II secretion system protein D [Burkholderia pseudomultivorans]MDR8743613.1 putative type II secretion system protein D [Burkholderia pseudomultivorans]MDR8755007.1 putative type II secretion system protein D [Burkholderia pseudomultivorans]MDR8780151.1 putative type II secretion system protein D [Burkholderia pseudomultivorans]